MLYLSYVSETAYNRAVVMMLQQCQTMRPQKPEKRHVTSLLQLV